MKFIKSILRSVKSGVRSIVDGFTALYIVYQMSKEENLDGSWDNYWERKNRKLQKRKRIR